jgi:ADP-ribose pyrophosphatase YjhB (NUDIX family)
MKSGDKPEDSGVRPVVAVGGVAVVDGSLLLVRRAKDPQAGRWTIPGGHVEPGETLASAVEREMLEETGLRVTCGAFLGWVERMGPGYHFVILDFTVTVPADATAPAAGGDAAAVAWVPLADVPGMSLVDGVEEFLRTHGILA